MTDPVDRAVDALIDVYRPDTIPPFEVVQARRRTRDRRRGAAAVTAVALAVVGVAFVPSMFSFGGDAQDDPLTVADGGGEPTVFEYRVQTDDAAAYRAAGADALTDLEVCLLYPGLSDQFTLFSGSPAYGGRVAGQAQADAFTACVEKVPGITATLTAAQPPAPDRALSGEPVAIERFVYTLSPDGRDVTVTVPVGGGCQTTGTAVVAAEEGTQVTLRATVTRPAAPSPSPLPPGVERACPANLVTQQATVRLDAPLANRFVIDGLDNKQIIPAQDTPEAFIERCLGNDRGQASPADGYVGTSEADIDRMITDDRPVIRVLGRNGECSDRDDDLRTDRVNVLIAGGEVIWAGRF